MKKNLFTLFLLLSAILSSAQVAPYSISSTGGWIGGGYYAGSSFLTLGAGQIDSIEVISRANQDYPTTTISIYSGNDTNVVDRLHKESAGFVPSGQNVPHMIRLTTPVQVNAASTYTFYVFGFPLRYSGSNSYANGTYWNDSGEQTAYDLDFVVYIGTVTAGVIGAVNENEENYIVYNSDDRKIEAAAQVSGDCQLMLFDIKGKKIMSSSDKQLILPSSIAEGIYVVKLQAGKVVYNRKIYIR